VLGVQDLENIMVMKCTMNEKCTPHYNGRNKNIEREKQKR